MLDHIGIYVKDYQKAKAFYVAALAPIGYKMHAEFAEWSVAGFGTERPDFWISPTNGPQNVHVAFQASDKAAVDAFYKAALDAGATDNGAPGYRKDYSPGYYGAFVRDLDGNNLEVVFHDPSPSV